MAKKSFKISNVPAMVFYKSPQTVQQYTARDGQPAEFIKQSLGLSINKSTAKNIMVALKDVMNKEGLTKLDFKMESGKEPDTVIIFAGCAGNKIIAELENLQPFSKIVCDMVFNFENANGARVFASVVSFEIVELADDIEEVVDYSYDFSKIKPDAKKSENPEKEDPQIEIEDDENQLPF